jgi:hypothetical protein
MNRFAATMLLMTLSAVAIPAAAAVVVDKLTAQPNPARSSSGHPPELEFEVTIKDRGMARILGCDLALDFGDGTPAVQQRFMDGGPRKATVKHVYDKPGSYIRRHGTQGHASGDRKLPGRLGGGARLAIRTSLQVPPGPPHAEDRVPGGHQVLRAGRDDRLPVGAGREESAPQSSSL